MLVIGLGCALLLAVALTVWVRRDVRAELFATPLAVDQVDEVVRQLAEWHVGFVSQPDNVRVDERERGSLLLRLSIVGIPHRHLSDMGETLDKVSPFTPQSVLDARKLDALGDELAQGLRGLAGVDDARVIVAPASESSFSDEPSHPATASVRIRLRPGAFLNTDEVEGIRRFVASGVPGLDSRAVAIIDDRGVAVSESQPGGDEEGLERKLQSALDASIGEGVAIVRVHLEREVRTVDRTETRRAPVGEKAITNTRDDERYHDGAKNYASQHSSEEHGSDLVDDRIHTPAGGVARISVAVLVDAHRRIDRNAVEKIAEATLGLDSGRGDQLHVEEIPFGRSTDTGNTTRDWIIGVVLTYLPEAGLIALILVVLARSGRPLAAVVEAALQRAAVTRTSREVVGYPPSVVRGALHGEPPHTAAAIISALPTATATAVLELYPPEERAAIVRRMTRTNAPVVPDWETVVRRA
jgi:flagellar biosynthesis/type III secretory pathway M-ring protein FliF/YscJ